MSGSIWGAYNGIKSISKKDIESIEGYPYLLNLATLLYEKASSQCSQVCFLTDLCH
jgi:hypothetical protein